MFKLDVIYYKENAKVIKLDHNCKTENGITPEEQFKIVEIIGDYEQLKIENQYQQQYIINSNQIQEPTQKERFFIEWENVTLIKIFETKVIDNRTKENDYIIFSIAIDEEKENFTAQHVGLTKEEEQSNKISFKSIDIDFDFSIDEHLQELHEECQNAILQSDIFTLAED
jgi:hypothetical protein